MKNKLETYSILGMLLISLITILSCNKDQELKIKIASIDISPNNGELNIGEERTIEINILPENASDKTISWASDNEEIANVNNTGKIHANKEGKVNIIATSNDGNKKAIYTLTVNKDDKKEEDIAVENITISKENIQINLGESIKIEYTILPATATNKIVKWCSSNNNIATINNQAILKSIAGGECTITTTTIDGNKTCSFNVIVIESVESIEILEQSSPLIEGSDIILKAKVLPRTATNRNFKWASQKEEIASIDQQGKVHGIKAGDAVITATTEDGNIVSSYRLEVRPKEARVTGINMPISEGEIKEGEHLRVIAYPEPLYAENKNIIWTSSNPRIASIENGNITGVSVGKVIITATTEDGGFSSNFALTVNTGYVPFNDPIFKQVIIDSGADKDNDGEISKSEALSIKRLELKELNIKNLTGLGDFKNLEYLDCSGNNIVNIFLLQATKLIDLKCNNCQLTSIEVTSSKELKNIDCSDNAINTLDLSKCSKLENINCSNNTISRFSIPFLPNLITFDCNKNGISSIDVSNCAKLKELNCNTNRITTLKLDNCAELTNLNCSKNQLKELDILDCLILEELNCSENLITGTIKVLDLIKANKKFIKDNSVVWEEESK